jgi:mRNA interferase MazF
MAITFHPEARMVLMCNFDTGFRAPEMTKIRPVVVLSPQRHNASTCLIVPLSTTEPAPIESYHHLLDVMSLPSRLRSAPTWVKSNMVNAVSLDRLDRIKDGKCKTTGKRLYVTHKVIWDDWLAIQRAVAIAAGITKILI